MAALDLVNLSGLLPKVVQGVDFTNGVEVADTPAQDAA